MHTSKQRRGLYASVPAQAFVFPSAEALGTPQDIARWQAHAHAECTAALARVQPALRSGLEKQYAIHRRLFVDRTQPQAECVLLFSLWFAPRRVPDRSQAAPVHRPPAHAHRAAARLR